MKRIMGLLLAVLMVIGVCGTAFAGQWTEDLHGRYYINDDGSYPTNKWQWIDDDGDGIAQCYYFDNSGYSVRNGKTPDGYETNMEGQWVIDGVVQQENAADVPVNGAQLSAAAAYTGTPVVVLAEYSYSKYGSNRYFYVIQNTGLETLDVTLANLAYAADGTILSAAYDTRIYALGPGCTSIIYSSFDTDGTIAYVVPTWRTSTSKSYQSVLQNLTYVQNDISKGAVFQITNNGIVPAKFVEGYALFFKNGKLVDYDWGYFVDDDSEIKPGQTISKQLDTYESFDSIQFYMTGRGSK